jgi:hypothetical protein
MLTCEGTLAALVLLLARLTTTPPEGAGPLSETVPVALLPPVTSDGFIATKESLNGTTVSTAVLLSPPYDAVIVTGVDELTGFVVTVNPAEFCPEGMVILLGTTAALVLLLVRLTTTPLEGAGPLRETVPVALLPPVALSGCRLILSSRGLLTVRTALLELFR